MNQEQYEVSVPAGLEDRAQELINGIGALYEDAADMKKAARRVSRLRDLTLVDLAGDLAVVIACDSNAAIGEKPDDSIKKPYTEQGISMLKVPLIEVLASGAAPALIVNNLCFEMEPYGKVVIESMRRELEKNGFGKKSEMRLGRTRIGDVICCVGDPKDGGVLKYSEFDRNTLSVAHVAALTRLPYIHEILPCGSHGTLYEAANLASDVGGSFKLFETKYTISLDTSAGSCTAAIVSLAREDLDRLRRDMDILITPIGTVEEAIA